MASEIEYKFLVRDDAWRDAADGGTSMCQGYLASGATGPSVRVRVAGEQAWLNVKQAVGGSLAVRQEFEYAIPVEDARTMLAELCTGPLVEKTRYHVPVSGHVFEVDVFHGDNHGLVVAEIEVEREGQSFPRPAWLGDEVSHDPRYLNQNLARHPYGAWRGRDTVS